MNAPERHFDRTTEIDEPTLILHRGDCETCGLWDSALNEGLCQECRLRFHVEPTVPVESIFDHD